MKRKVDEAFEDDCDSYLKIKESKKVKIKCAITNIISNNRSKLRELFTGEKMHELLPLETYLPPSAISTIRENYKWLMDCYENIKDLETFNNFENAYEKAVNDIIKQLPLQDNSYVVIDRVNIPMPFGLFYAVITKLKDAYSAGTITWSEYAACRDYALRVRGTISPQYSLMSKHMNYMYYDELISPSDQRYNELDVKYLDVIDSFLKVYNWWVPKVIYMFNAGLSLDVDRYKIHVKLGELVALDNYKEEDLIELN